MIQVTVSTQTKLDKSPFYYAVLHWVDPIKKDQYKWKTTKVKYVDENIKKLHKQAEKEANNKAEEIRKKFEEDLNTKVIKNNTSVANDRAKQKFADYIVEWANRNKREKRSWN